MSAVRRGLLGLAAGLALAGCGFELAEHPGADAPAPGRLLHVAGGEPDFRAELRRALRRAGARVAPAADAAELAVELAGPEAREQVIGVTDRMDAREYELELRLTVRRRAASEAWSAPETLSRRRHWVFDPDAYLAADEERSVILEELRAELIGDLFRLLAAEE